MNGELVAANNSAITAFVPSYVRKIGTSAFMDSASLTALSANEGLEFGVSAFANCKKLQYFNDPETIYFIDNAPDYVFYDCQKLILLALPHHQKFSDEYTANIPINR